MKELKDHPGYFISKEGNVFSTKRNIYLTPYLIGPARRQYWAVTIGGKVKKIHRLLAETYLPNPEGKPIVRHIDDDPNNNSLDNLAWGTYSENLKEAFANGKRVTVAQGERNNSSKLTEQDVINIKQRALTETPYQIQKDYPISPSYIYKIISGNKWGHIKI